MSTRHSTVDERQARAVGSVSRLAAVMIVISWVALAASVAVHVVSVIAPSVAVPAAAGPAIAAVSAVALLLYGASLVWIRRRIGHHLKALDRERLGLREAYDRARLDALLDALTGLGNHRAFQEDLDVRVADARDAEQPLALVMIDVDDLKVVNDVRGHGAGDDLLRTVAQIMRANLRRGDGAYRTGGDEFALLLSACDMDGAEVVANHLLAAALSGNHGRSGSFSITVGVTAFPSPSADRHQLIHHADAALYSGKRAGRTRVQRFDPARHGIAEDTRSLSELEGAVLKVASDGLLRAVYQPIYDLSDGVILGFEGLVRPTPDSGFKNATSLFVAAEATRRTVELDIVCARAVMESAVGLGRDQYLSINLSPRTLESDTFSPLEILALARRVGLDPKQLVVELTEREAIDDLKQLKATIDSLRRHEVRVAIDDIGAGNAGLRLLSEIDFDIMKIDLSLVRAGATRDASEAVLRALGSFAQSRGHRVVAEGIETSDHLESVLELHYDAGQGYLLGKAEPTLVRGDIDLVALMTESDDFTTAA